eukprot:Unigene4476_Nuclearia_a/m.13685 Unigene4476_Nuclearia_a/g.13685  ORF Unigene4476_Nuclearia_a/g.13685 Unigene4476_Nuclearia_a/m.13685 type:complete len:311 (+) Unigene4476_Nuclearia_a:160-1092(+)
MDSAVVPTRVPGVVLVQTTDFFYPNVDDPYEQGRIACANVLSDLYAMGVHECDNVLMLLGLSTDLTADEKQIVGRMLIRGFSDTARAAGCGVTGGQTVLNPWIVIGGVATAVLPQADVIMPVGARAGDVIVLTKPLGTQVAVNAHQWLRGQTDKWHRIAEVVTEADVTALYFAAQRSMARLNRTGARLMHTHGAHAATDVTGFGILGHARNLASNQRTAVSFVIHTLPVLRGCVAICGRTSFKLLDGLGPETSGGLLVALTREDAELFMSAIREQDGCPAWIVGDVVNGSRTAELAPDCRVVEVDPAHIV